MLLVGFMPRHSLAQTAVLPRGSAGGGIGADISNIALETYAPADLRTLDATAWRASDRGAIAGETAAARFASGHILLYGVGHAALDVVRSGTSRMTLQADGGGGSYRGQASTSYGQASLTLSRDELAGGQMWASAAVGRASSVGAYTTAHVAVGGAISRGPATVSATVKAVHERANYADADARLAWQFNGARGVPALQLAVDAGARGGRRDPYGRWANMEATVAPGARVQLVGAFGVFPSNREVGALHARALTVGVHIALHSHSGEGTTRSDLPASPNVRIAKTGAHDEHAIFVHEPNATTVELMGDFTQWGSVVLTRVSGGEWRGDFNISPGAHRVDIRVNGGAWQPLAGVPRVADDFGGSSSLLVIP